MRALRHFTLLLLTLSGWAAGATEEKIAFNRDIRPILSENCFACHGADAKRREAKLRLDLPESALAVKDDVAAITPGDPAKSEAWLRLQSTDPDEVMPPPKAHKSMTAAQKELIKRWIEQGAPFQSHWSFTPPVKALVPQPAGGGENPVDAFLLERLGREGLAMRPEADRPTLIRRVTFALTGLPPTLEEVKAYEADRDPMAYEKVVDRCLASPRFGEEMARPWLDLARYGDTHGLHLDNERSMWPYRDWVVRAFNENLPYDDFTRWQIAGDLLPQATADQLTATGFNRCNVSTNEGGTVEAEFLHRYALDRTSTFFSTWMGLTAGCAACHDHKFDPLSTREFYSVYAFFNNAADPGLDKNIAFTDPVHPLPTAEQEKALASARQDEEAAGKMLDAAAARLPYAEPKKRLAAQNRSIVVFDDAPPVGASARDVFHQPSTWVWQPAQGTVSGKRVLRQAGSDFYGDTIAFISGAPLLPEKAILEAWVWMDPVETPHAVALEIDGKRALWGVEDPPEGAQLGEATQVLRQGDLPKAGVWVKLSIAAEALGLKAGASVQKVSVAQVGGIALWDFCTLQGEANSPRDPLLSFEQWIKGAGRKAPAEMPPALAAALMAGEGKTLDAAMRPVALVFFLGRVAYPATPEIAQLRATWEEARARRAAVEEAIPRTLIFRESAKPRETFVMIRGQYDKPGERVDRATPAFLPALAAPAAPTRLDLAQWLLAPEHPLTARVEVNRLWQQLFGVGLVKTSHDFGSQGEPPSHPELLDWLAVDFQESHWDVKALVRRLVTSRAFRQQSTLTPEVREKDPENRLLARGPRLRLEAEQIRDNVLFVSGLINLAGGGRGDRGYQPPNLWEPGGYVDSNTRHYMQDHGPALYRRSLYQFLKRTAPPPFMSGFDAPSREQTCTRRERSDTPMQALQLMNDVQHFEAARALAERALAEPIGEEAARLEWLFRTVLARSPEPREAALLQTALQRQRQLYLADPAAAAQVIAVGESPARSSTPAPETAAWTLLANLVLNLDETLNRN